MHMDIGQLPGPGVKGLPRGSWRTVVHKTLSALKVELKVVQACPKQTSLETVDC